MPYLPIPSSPASSGASAPHDRRLRAVLAGWLALASLGSLAAQPLPWPLRLLAAASVLALGGPVVWCARIGEPGRAFVLGPLVIRGRGRDRAFAWNRRLAARIRAGEIE